MERQLRLDGLDDIPAAAVGERLEALLQVVGPRNDARIAAQQPLIAAAKNASEEAGKQF